jgi:hypothetical protein
MTYPRRSQPPSNTVIFIIAAIGLGLIVLLATLQNAEGATLVEPTTNIDGSAIEDLAGCTVSATEAVTGATGSTTYAATSQNGGGQHSIDTRSLLGWAPEGEVTFDAYCVDFHNNASESAVLIVDFPLVPPTAPEVLP